MDVGFTNPLLRVVILSLSDDFDFSNAMKMSR